MNSNRNLIVALIALWCYTRNCNINLANNTSILLILYALLTRGYLNSEQVYQTYSRTPRLFSQNHENCTQQTFGMPNNNGSFAFPFNVNPFRTTQYQCPLY
jgi:hypothetical protein